MATRESIARRRDIAARRIADVLAELHARYDDAPVLDLHPTHRDLDERNAALLEAIAAGVEFMLSRIEDAERAAAEQAEADSPRGESDEGEKPKRASRDKRGR